MELRCPNCGSEVLAIIRTSRLYFTRLTGADEYPVPEADWPEEELYGFHCSDCYWAIYEREDFEDAFPDTNIDGVLNVLEENGFDVSEWRRK